ncbi:Uncharacterised protein [Enterobacter cloacae]|nr:Uncharacterised protein [Enterobacter cloacae]
MIWLGNVLIEVLATIVYMFVLFPLWVVLYLCFMVLVLLSLPLKIAMIRRYLGVSSSQDSTKEDN